MKSISLLLPGIMIFTLAFSAAAQVTGINLGDRIRVDAPAISSEQIGGIITDISADQIRISHGVRSLDIPWFSIDNLYLERGKKRYVERWINRLGSRRPWWWDRRSGIIQGMQ